VVVVDRRLFDRVGFAISAGAGPASAGLATSAPVAAGAASVERRDRLLAMLEPVLNEHGWPPDTGDRVNLFLCLRPRSETIVGEAVGVVVAAVADGVVAMSPICSATAV